MFATVRLSGGDSAVCKNLTNFPPRHGCRHRLRTGCEANCPRFGNRALASSRMPKCARGRRISGQLPELQTYCGSAEATTLPSDSVDFVAGAGVPLVSNAAARMSFIAFENPEGRVLGILERALRDETAFRAEIRSTLNRFAGLCPRQRKLTRALNRCSNFLAPMNLPHTRCPIFRNSIFEGLSGACASSSYAAPRASAIRADDERASPAF